MKLRELKHKSGKSTEHVWPPSWGSSYGRGDTFAMGDQGTLTAVERMEGHLYLTIEHEGRKHSGSLQWDAPPSLDDVEKVLRANIGRPIKDLGELTV